MSPRRVKCFAPLFSRSGCGSKAVPLVYSLCGGLKRMCCFTNVCNSVANVSVFFPKDTLFIEEITFS